MGPNHRPLDLIENDGAWEIKIEECGLFEGEKCGLSLLIVADLTEDKSETAHLNENYLPRVLPQLHRAFSSFFFLFAAVTCHSHPVGRDGDPDRCREDPAPPGPH